MSSEELTAELLERRKALLADITALRALFQEKLRAGNTVEIKRVGTLLKGYESIYWHLLVASHKVTDDEAGAQSGMEEVITALGRFDENVKMVRSQIDDAKPAEARTTT